MSQPTGWAAGGYDWLDVWRRMYDTERNQAEGITSTEGGSSQDCWAQRAARFAVASNRVAQPDGSMQLLLPHLQPTDSVLDVGSGTGRYVPFLAERVARVIAVEPSPAMRAHLEQRVAEAGLRNVEIIGDAWPLSYAVHADVVLSAHVLYGVREVGPFLQAMHAVAGRMCMLFLMLKHINQLFSPFWERFHGQSRHPLPCALEALNVLYQLGHTPTLELVPANRVVYQDRNEAFEDIRLRLRLPHGSGHDAALMEAIEELLIKHEDGRLSLPNQPVHAAVLRWEVATSNQSET